MQAVAQLNASAIGTLAAVATTWCTCSVNSSVMVNCTTATCNTYDLPIQYVQTQATATVPVLIGFPGLPLNFSLSAVSTLRAR